MVGRRTVLRAGVGAIAGGSLAQSSMRRVAAQQSSPWPAQGFDAANTGMNPAGTPVKAGPAVLDNVDVPAGVHADYLVGDGVAYLHSAANGVGAVDLASGELLWRFEQGNAPLVPEFLAGDVIVVRSVAGPVYVLDRGDGRLVDEVSLGQGLGLGFDGEQWYAPLSEGRIVAYNRETNDQQWETPVDGVAVRPTVAEDRVFVSTIEAPPDEIDFEAPGSMDAQGRLYALDASDGSVIWEAGRVGAGVGSPVVRDGRVFWTGADGDILMYDAATGDSGWEYKTDGSFPATPAVTPETVFAGNANGQLYGLTSDTGEELGTIDAGGPLRAPPVIVDGVAYYATTDGLVHAFEYGDSGHLWTFDAGAPVRALAAGDARVFVGTTENYYILGPGDPSNTQNDGGTNNDDTAGGMSGSSESDSADSSSGSAERERGLFSNDGSEPAFISNVFNLTMLGFLLSVAGIIHQLLGGR